MRHFFMTRQLSFLAQPRCFLGLFLPFLLATPLQARTITLTAEDCDQMAAISALAPRVSWAMHRLNENGYNSQDQLVWSNQVSLLMRFPFSELIPKDQRITKAELTIPAAALLGGVPEIHVRRILAEWGTGVCHKYRMVHPQKVEWAEPGGRGNSTDRANKSSAVFKIADMMAEQTVNLTEDVELWYSGAVANRGWIFTMENDATLYLPSPYAPYGGSGKRWKLVITFEPK
jgi:hypothetical protein